MGSVCVCVCVFWTNGKELRNTVIMEKMYKVPQTGNKQKDMEMGSQTTKFVEYIDDAKIQKTRSCYISLKNNT